MNPREEPTDPNEVPQPLTTIRKMVTDQPVTIAIVSSDQLFLEGTAALVGQWDEFRVVSKSTNAESAIKACQTLKPDMCLVNAELNDSNQFRLTGNIVKRLPDTKVIVISPSGEDDDVIEALRLGIHGYCLQKEITAFNLRGMIWGVMSGAVMLYGMKRSSFNRPAKPDDKPQAEPNPLIGTLTKREKDILLLLTRGLSNAEIGRTLYLSEATVKKNVARITDKLQVDNRVQAAVLAARYMDHTDETD